MKRLLLSALLLLALASSALATGTLTTNYPNILPAVSGTTSQVVTLTNSSAAWTTSAPSLSISGVTGASLGTVTVIDSTHLQVNVFTGAAFGTATLTDATTASSALLNVCWTNAPGNSWVVEKASDFTAAATTSSGAAGTTTGTGGDYIDEQGSTVVVANGSIIALPVATPGAGYTPGAYPTLSITGGLTGSATSNAGTFGLNWINGGTQLGSITIGLGGSGYASATTPTKTLSGGTAPTTAATLGTLVISPHALRYLAGNSYGTDHHIDRPASVNTINQREVVQFYDNGSGYTPSMALRIQNPANQYYVWEYGTNQVQLAYNNNYPTGGLTNLTSMITVTGGFQLLHLYLGDFEATSPVDTSHTNLSATITDIGSYDPVSGAFTPAQNVVWSAHVVGDATVAVQSAGQVGLGTRSSSGGVQKITTYVSPGFNLAPTSAGLGQNVTLTVTAQGINFTTNPPTFTVSGGTGASVVSQSVTDSLHATVTVNTGSSAATGLTLTDTVSGYANVLGLVPASVALPGVSAYSSVGGVSLTGNTLTGTAAVNGVAPYTYSLLRDVYGATTTGTVVSTQSSVSAGVAPAAVTDTGSGPGLWWYKWKAVDSGTPAQTVYSTPTPALVGDKAIQIGFLGDSRIQGHTANNVTVGWAANAHLLTGGNSYTLPPIVTISGGSGSGATAISQLDGTGHVKAIATVNHGRGYAQGDTLTLTITNASGDTTGTGATGNVGLAGGLVLQTEKDLQDIFGIHSVTCLDGGVDGTGSGWIGTQYLKDNMLEFGPPSLTPFIVMDWGVNDAAVLGSGLSPVATYKANMLANAQYLTALGYIVILNCPYYQVPQVYSGSLRTDAANDRIEDYGTAIQQIVATDPSHIKLGMSTSFALMSLFPSELGDGLHPNDTGVYDLAHIQASVLAPYVGLYTKRLRSLN